MHPSVLKHRKQHINIVNVYSPAVNYLFCLVPAVLNVGQIWCMRAVAVQSRMGHMSIGKITYSIYSS